MRSSLRDEDFFMNFKARIMNKLHTCDASVSSEWCELEKVRVSPCSGTHCAAVDFLVDSLLLLLNAYIENTN